MRQTLLYTIKKLLWTVPILVGITFLAFGLGLIARGDPATNRASADPDYIPTEAEIQALREELGLDDPVLVQYGRWMAGVVRGDLGQSLIDDKPVLGELLRLLPNTLLLSVLALAVIAVAGLAGGLLLALFRDSFLDLLGRVLLVLLMSVPGFCMAYFLIWLLAQKLHILPTSGAESLASFVMPCLAVSIGSACVVIRLLRSSLLGEMSKNYILTAQAKGLRRSQIILRHGLRNALTPSVSYVANTFGGLLGGSMITESVFSVPGIGSYALAAINNRDYIAIQGYVLFTGFAFVLACLLADLLCAWLNPRIRLEG
ncbi:ABC transporter permease [Flavonifractor sp. An306]|uniref:ABC transporter permease n=1 Tax=Flavonifractor sp. An306 TaxID=1965629 RepID=UPI00174DB5B1|nr:ABC transporter permease [Flavonifractor sp. An306]